MSSKEELVDRSGHSFTVNGVDGYYFHRGSTPIPFDQHLDGIKEMAIRPDDVMICSYPKSGLHWLWEVVNMIAHEDLIHRSHIENMNQPDFRAASELDQVPSPRVLSNHLRFRFLPRQLSANNTKVILLERDPKSVAVSFYNMTIGMKGVESYNGLVSVKEYDGSWDDYLEMFLEGKVVTMSSKVELVDRSGHSFTVNGVDGYYFHRGSTPIPFHQHLDRNKEMAIRPDDVMICSYPKSGLHWLWEVVNMIAHEDLIHRSHIENMNQPDFRAASELDQVPSPRVLSNHLRFRFLPRQLSANNTKVILLERDPKSVAVSFYNMTIGMKGVESYNGLVSVKEYDGSWDDYLEMFLEGKVVTMSSKVELVDRSGHSFTVNGVDGYYFHRGSTPIPFHQHLDRNKEMAIRPDDVMICSYPKSGLHWLWEVVNMIAHEDLIHRSHIENMNQPDFRAASELDQVPSPRVLSNHLRFRFLPRQLSANNTKVILLERDPKSVAVSFYNMTIGMKGVESYNGLVSVKEYDGSWDDYLEMFLEGKVVTMSSKVELVDRSGHSFTVNGVDGYYFHRGSTPIPFDQHLDRIKEMAIRPDDVMICSYPKSGLHWLWEVVNMIAHEDLIHRSHIENMNQPDFRAACELDQVPSPRVLSSHLRFRFFPRQLSANNTKIILLERDPKSVAVSFYNMTIGMKGVESYNGLVSVKEYDGSWDDYLEMFLEGKVVTMSSKVELVDRSGHSFTVNGVDGYYFHRGSTPIPFDQHLDRIKEMAIRPDDVMICSYPKSGLHWLWEVVNMIAHEDLIHRSHIENMNQPDFRAACELDQVPSPRFLSSHLRFRFPPRQLSANNTKIILLERDPKSVAVSFYNMTIGMKGVESYNGLVSVKEYDGSWDDYLQMFLEGKVVTMSSKVELVDRSGHSFTVNGVDGYYFHRGSTPIPFDQHLDRIKEMAIRPDDVMICSYPKSGLHWLWEVVNMIAHEDLIHRSHIENMNQPDFRAACELDQVPSPRFLSSHLRFRFPPRQLSANNTKIILLERDPKSVAVSFYNMTIGMKGVESYNGLVSVKEYDGSWDDYLQMFLEGKVVTMSSKVELVDRSGHSFTVNGVDGYYFHRGSTPIPFDQHLDRIKEMAIRPDDVMICSYPKSGLHWLWEVVNMIAHEDLIHRSHIENMNQPDFRAACELDQVPSPRFLSSHLRFRFPPRQLSANNTKIILLERDPKSVAVSFYNMTIGMKGVESYNGLVSVKEYDGSWDDYLQMFLEGKVVTMSSKVELVDRSGHSFTVNGVDGYYFHRGSTPIPFDQHLDRIKEMAIRPDDVMICSYPKSGLHWLWEVVNMIAHEDLIHRSHIENMNQPDFRAACELDQVPSPRFLSSHLRFRFPPRQLSANNTKIILLERDPKSVAVSFYNMTIGMKGVESYNGLVSVKEYDGSWDDYLQMFLEGKVVTMSSKVELVDRSGHSFTVNGVDGYYFRRGSTPIPFDQHLDRIKEMAIRPDDVMICSYPKSGLHWLWEVVNMIAHEDLIHRSHIENMNQPDFRAACELDQVPSPRFLSSHLRFRFPPRQLSANNTKIILLERDPKSVAVSFYNMTIGMKGVESYNGLVSVKEYDGSWDDYLQMFLEGKVVTMSSKVELVDRSGHSFTVNGVDGYYFRRGSTPIPFDQHLDRIKEMAIRPDDVMICSYPKSGLHWLWEVVNMIAHEDLIHRSHIENMNQPDFRAACELDQVPSPRFLSSHLRFRFPPRQLSANNTKIILLERDPKSVAVSFYNMTIGMKGVESYNGLVSVKEYDGSWDDYLQMFLEGKVVTMSSKVELVDRSGHSFTVNGVDGYYFHRGSTPIPFDQHLDRIKEMAIRPDDVMICSYPKSGLHWLWEVVNMIAHEDLIHRSHIENMNQPDFRAACELDQVPSPRFLSSHLRFRFPPRQLSANNTKIILLERDPKSVAVSFYNMTIGMKGVESYNGLVSVKEYDGSWDDYLQMFLEGKVPYGSWFDYTLEWKDIRKQHPHLSLMALTFADMKQDLVACIWRVAEFLGKQMTPERAKCIAEACTFHNLKERDRNEDTKTKDIAWREGSGFFRKGTTTDWKNWFTVAQSEQFAKVYATKWS